MTRRGAAILALSSIGFATSAQALCTYKGELYAQTTIEQEFNDAKLVVKATVLACRDKTFSDEDETDGVFCSVRIEKTFKGRSKKSLSYFSARNSGGFYLDIGDEYLLFLDPAAATDWAKFAPNSVVVNYNCGQSQAWSKVSSRDKDRLNALSKQGP